MEHAQCHLTIVEFRPEFDDRIHHPYPFG